MNRVIWLSKGHKFDCQRSSCVDTPIEYTMATQLTAIKERLRHYHFARLEQENDFISLMIIVEKLLEEK